MIRIRISEAAYAAIGESGSVEERRDDEKLQQRGP
jgi:hypothetical protein